MVQVYGFTQLSDNRANWIPTGRGRLVPFNNMYNVCYGKPCVGIYDQGAGLAGATSSVDLDQAALGLKDFPQVEVGFSVRVGFIAYYNPHEFQDPLYPINVRTMLGGVVYDDLVQFLTLREDTQRPDAESPAMTTISHTTTVDIPSNRTLRVQMLFDLSPTIAQHPFDYYTPFLITDWVSLYVEGRPEKKQAKNKSLIIGNALGWTFALLILGVLVYVYVRRRNNNNNNRKEQAQQLIQRQPSQVYPVPNMPILQPPAPMMMPQQSTTSLSMRTGSVPPPPPPISPAMSALSRFMPTVPVGGGTWDALREYAAAHRAYISPELEEKLRMASYFPLDNPDTYPMSTWREHGVSDGELNILRELYQMNQGWRLSAIGGG